MGKKEFRLGRNHLLARQRVKDLSQSAITECHIVLTQAELQSLPASWKSALSQWRGIYFIYDASRQAGYVGSAYGSENILGRWRDYARTGHGGNRGLKSSAAGDLRFSILQRTSPDLDTEAIVALEASWKQRLHTRDFGLNRN